VLHRLPLLLLCLCRLRLCTAAAEFVLPRLVGRIIDVRLSQPPPLHCVAFHTDRGSGSTNSNNVLAS
jgi:hypothetical protein